jgi:hypothetical protein
MPSSKRASRQSRWSPIIIKRWTTSNSGSPRLAINLVHRASLTWAGGISYVLGKRESLNDVALHNLVRAKLNALPHTRSHEHHQKPRNAPACDLLDTRRDYSAVPHHHPDYHNGDPSAGGWHFDPYRKIRTPLKLHSGSSLSLQAFQGNPVKQYRANNQKRPRNGIRSL